jgi:hypothetical protein
MKVKDLVEALLRLDQEKEVVIQRSYDKGYYAHYKPLLQPEGHIGHSGPVIHIGEQIDIDVVKKVLGEF